MRTRVFIVFLVGLLFTSCSYFARKEARVAAKGGQVDAALNEESQALTTGIVDALAVAPTNAATDLAKRFAQRDQQIEGVPQKRIPVTDLLSSNVVAWAELMKRFKLQEELIEDRARIKAERDEALERLAELGKLYEAEKNKSIVKRIWAWTFSTLGVGGIVALCIFFPALIPVIGSLVGWVVGKVPQLAGFFGVVSKKAFDAAAKGIENVRHKLKEGKQVDLEMVDTELTKAQDADHRALVRARKQALGI